MEKTINDVWQFTSAALSDEEYFIRPSYFISEGLGIGYVHSNYNHTYMSICGQALADFTKREIKVWVGKHDTIFTPIKGTVFANAKSKERFFEEILETIASFKINQNLNLIKSRPNLIYPTA